MVCYLKAESTKFEHELKCKEDCKNDIKDIKEFGVQFGLVVKFHGQTKRIDQDHGKDGVLKHWWCHECPKLVLDRIFRNVTPYWLCSQSNFNAISLKFKTNVLKILKVPYNDPGIKCRPARLLIVRAIVAYLIFVKLAIFICRLSLVLKRNDNKTYEYVDHEKGYDDNVYEVKTGNNGSVIVYGTMVFCVGIDGNVEDAAIK